MRKYLYLITEHPDDDMVGKVVITDKPKLTGAQKNKEGVCQKRNLDTGETWQYQEVGLGYADFDDEEDYEERISDVIDEKFDEIDDEHLEKAGIELEGVSA